MTRRTVSGAGSRASSYDVIVAGGGSAGVAAAVGAARMGARTLLLERGPCLGGAATLRNVLTYAGLHTRTAKRQVVFGVAEEVLDGLRQHGAVGPPTTFNATSVVFEPETLKFVLDLVCARAGVEVRLHSQIVAADREGDRLTAVGVADHAGIWEHRAPAFVDATGEADLASRGRASVRYGNGGKVQNGSLGVRFGGLTREADIGREEIAGAVRDAKVRGLLPSWAAETGLVARLPISGDVITYLVDEGYDARDAAETSRAEAHARAQAQVYLQILRTLDGCRDAYIVTTGPELGSRESRHIVGRHVMVDRDVLTPRPFGEAVAVGAWPIEYHPGPGVPSEWRFIGEPEYYGIPLDALRSHNTGNLFAAGRTVDGERGAGASMRVMGTAFATGHAAGVAAGGLAGHGDVHLTRVRDELSRQDARLPS